MSLKYTLVVNMFLLFTTFALSQQSTPSNVSLNNIKKSAGYDIKNPTIKTSLTLNIEGHSYVIELKENKILSKSFKNNYPNVKTYSIYNSITGVNMGALTISPELTSMMIKTVKGFRMLTSKNGQKFLHFESDIDEFVSCGVNKKITKESLLQPRPNLQRISNILENGTLKRTYRMAIVTTGEYYVENGGTDASVAAAVASHVNSLQAIYDKELNINFEVLTPFLYNDPDTDPFIPDNLGGDSRTIQAMNAITSIFNIAEYDLGHVLHDHAEFDSWSTGGVAYLESVCDDGFVDILKAGGWSGAFNTSSVGFIKVFAHEVGHMFSATHTFNGNGGSCTDNISEFTAFEIGSGTTIMSYKGLCRDTQNIVSQGALDHYFHAHSLLQIINYVNDEGNCPVVVDINNNPPIADANPCSLNWVIPKNTPFLLTGSGTDVDGDSMTYIWEQYDEDGPGSPTQGFIGNDAVGNTNTPVFRSYPPSDNNRRYFPSHGILFSNADNFFDVLPNVARTLNFRFTVRDNNPNGGAIGQDELAIDVSNNGPLKITKPNVAETVIAGEVYNFRWSTGGSDNLCNLVDIELSTDGGNTFSIMIGKNINYSDEQIDFTIPLALNNTIDARVRIKCIDNECFQFFNVSPTSFRISSLCYPDNSSICDEVEVSADQGDPELELELEYISGELFDTMITQIVIGSPKTHLAIKDFTGNGCGIVVNNRQSESFILRVGKSGEYKFDMECFFASPSASFFSIFTEENFDPMDPCISFLGSNGQFANPLGTSALCFPEETVTLEVCVEYRVVFWSFAITPINVRLSNITGPGNIYVNDITNAEYGYTYVAVDINSDKIMGYHDLADFRALAPGSYNVYGMSYKKNGITPPQDIDLNTILGKDILDLAVNGDCVLLSENYKPITIITSCFIDEVTLGQQFSCDPIDNSFSQEMIISYTLPPPGAMLVVNGQNFALSTSPQTIILEGLESNGEFYDVDISFSNDPFCAFFASAYIQAPENCCPINIGLDNMIEKCDGDILILNAGLDGVIYEWSMDGIPLSESTNELMVTENGVYEVIVTNNTGCIKGDMTTVNFVDSPTIETILNGLICEGDLYQFDIVTNVADIEIFKDQQSIATNVTSYTISEAGMYSVVVRNDADCISEVFFELVVATIPIINLGADQVACIGSEVLITSGMIADSYEWTLQGEPTILGQNASLTVTENGIYVLTATNQGICQAIGQVEISFVPGPLLSLSDDIDLCEGDMGIIIATTNGNNIQWYRDGVLIVGETGFTLEVTQAGIYEVIVSGSSNCEVRQSTIVQVFDNPIINLGGDQSICEGDTYILNAETGIMTDEYSYFFNGTQIGLPSNTTSIEISDQGNYTVVIINENNCSIEESINLVVNPLPSLSLDGNQSLCLGTTGLIDANSNASTFEWYLNSNLLPETGSNLTINSAGIYKCIAISSSNCKTEEEFIVISVNTPIVNLGMDIDLCPGQSIVLDAGPHSSYQWSTGSTNQSIEITAPSLTNASSEEFTIAVTNNDNCQATDEITINYMAVVSASIFANANGVCEGESIALQASGGLYYAWDNSDGSLNNDNIANVIASPLQSTIYSVTISDDCPNNQDIANIQINVYNGAGISAGPDTCIIVGQQYEMQAVGGSIYDWDNESTIIGDENKANIIVAPEETTLYTVEITDANGCIFIDEVEICVVIDPLSIFKAVSIISPNGDGKNDALRFPGLESFSDNNLVIFNRWGNVVFKKEGYQISGVLWDGTRNGEKLPPGTYFYVLSFDTYTFKSSITIIYN